MADRNGAHFRGSDFDSIQAEVLLNLVAIVKVQQINIELLWKTFAAGAPPHEELRDLRESTVLLTDCMEQVHAVMLHNIPSVH